MPVTLPETIVQRRCAALIPYARNARTHSGQQIAQIAASIREFGFTNPVLIDEEDGIIAGHGRVLAAHLLGLDEVPCIVLAHLSPTQCRAYVIADNKLALNAGWDLEMLSLEIGEIGEAGFDLNLTGFDEFELGELFAERTQGRTDPDDAPKPPAHPVAEPGDLWVLGRHRLLCGDSTRTTAFGCGPAWKGIRPWAVAGAGSRKAARRWGAYRSTSRSGHNRQGVSALRQRRSRLQDGWPDGMAP